MKKPKHLTTYLAALCVTAVAAAALLHQPPEDTPAPKPLHTSHQPADPTLHINTTDGQAIHPFLTTDPNPDGPTTTGRVRLTNNTPISTHPGSPPVGYLTATTVKTPTILPIFERQENWVMVPIMARTGLPSEGHKGQTVAWIDTRHPNVTEHTDPTHITIDTKTGTLTIHYQNQTSQHKIGLGQDTSPTPPGRTAIAATWIDETATYTKNGDTWTVISALTRYSDTQDAFTPSGTTTPAAPLLAIHYHPHHTGHISNGCIRVDAPTNQAITRLPLGTPIQIR